MNNERRIELKGRLNKLPEKERESILCALEKGIEEIKAKRSSQKQSGRPAL